MTFSITIKNATLSMLALNIVMLSDIMLNAVMLSDIMLNAVMLNAIMLGVVAPLKTFFGKDIMSNIMKQENNSMKNETY
jgi:hypothetical protein